MQNIPDSHRDLLTDEKKAYAYLATITPGGAPQLTPVWFNVDGEYILVNTAKGRVKERNMRGNPNVAILIADPKDPYYRFLQIRGRVAEITETGANEHINTLSLKYDGTPWTPREGQVRVIYKIKPEKIFAGN